MSDTIIYKGLGNADMYDDFIDFVNYVFGCNGNERDFRKMLPKCYRREYDPCGCNYVITEDGKIKAAAGAYDSVFKIGEHELRCRGIGNVAVHPYSRSKGYMIECMNLALEDMIRDGIDISALGGLRNRYNYFGFEKCGQQCSASVTRNNIRHIFGSSSSTELTFKRVTSDDTVLISKMHEVHEKKAYRSIRSRETFLDVCCSWYKTAYAVLDGDEFIGYFIGNLQELTLCDVSRISDVIRCYVERHGDVRMVFSPFDSDMVEAMEYLAEDISLTYCANFNVLNYEKVISALLSVKSSYTKLSDGVLTVRINGFARVESLKITVENGVPSVCSFDGECELNFDDHLKAMAYFFGIPRMTHDPLGYFPLPLYWAEQDHV